jgi:hypothetical protein
MKNKPTESYSVASVSGASDSVEPFFWMKNKPAESYSVAPVSGATETVEPFFWLKNKSSDDSAPTFNGMSDGDQSGKVCLCAVMSCLIFFCLVSS